MCSRCTEWQELKEADNQWINDTLWHHGVEHKPASSSLKPWAAVQYLSAKPDVSQFCGGRQTARRLARHYWQRSIVYEAIDFIPPCKPCPPATQGCLTIYPIKLRYAKRENVDRITSCRFIGHYKGDGFGNPSVNFWSIQIKFVWMDWLWITERKLRCCLVMWRI